MSKRLKTWRWPALSFLAAGVLALLAGPTLGAVGRLRLIQMATAENPDFAGCMDAGQSPQGGVQTGQSAGTWKASAAPIQYASGNNLLAITEFEASGPLGWTQRRAVRGDLSQETLAGVGWKVSGLLQLMRSGSGLLYMVNGTTSVRTFVESTLTPLGWYKDTITTNSGDQYIVTDPEGNQWYFYGWTFYSSTLAGKLNQAIDRYGNQTLPTYGTSGVTLDKILQIDQFPVGDPNNGTRIVYTYNLSGVAAGQLSSVAYQRVVAGTPTTVRQVDYTYYLSSGSNGNAAQLQWARVTDGTNTLDTYYHRYDTTNGNYPVKLILGPQAYERAKASLGSDAAIDAATDTTLSTWADYKFTYNGGTIQVASETVQGTGCSCGPGGGTGTFSLSYSTSTHGAANGPNVWWQKAVETLPDGNQNIVYSNSRGHTMLEIFKNVGTGQEWMTYHLYDENYRELFTFMPSAVISYNDAFSSLAVNLQSSSGLVYRYTFYSTTNLSFGQVAGYRADFFVQQGSLGTPIPISQTKYTSQTANSKTVYPVSSITQYRNTDGTGAITTSFSYSWHPFTTQMQERVTTYPAVTTAQNGSNAATSTKEQFDILGRLIWTMDQDGYINYTEYNPSTAAVVKQIRDVNTTLVSNEPAGWVTPAGGGLHLITEFETDNLGRVTKVTDPLGQISYTVYKDVDREVRQYPGWDTGTNLPTGPTQVSRQDRPGSYSESLTMSATPATSGGRPTGTEAVSSLQSLSRSYKDTGDRLTYTDSYFNFSGLTYSTAPNIGTQGTHFYRATVGYDSKGRQDRSVSWDGTITRTVFDAKSRVISAWIGTDDTPTSGDWSPTNTAGTNLNKMSETEYDSGGVGDGNVTRNKMMTSASTSIDTVYQYDFRNRKTDTRGQNLVASRSTYDNLDRVITSETYADADSNFVIGSTELRGKSETKYDERGQVYQTITHHVNPTTGAIGNRLTSNTWYNARRMAVKSQDPNGLFQKTQYDGAARTTASFVSYDASESTYTQAFDVSGDDVIEESVPSYDAAGRTIQTTRYQRTSGGSVPTGALSSGWAVGNSRRSFTAAWYDLGNRTTTTADYGNNGDSAFSRPGTPPAPNSSPDVLVTKLEYDAGGRQHKTTNNLNKVTQRSFDGLSRVTKTIQNYDNGVSAETELDLDKISETAYDSVGRKFQETAHNPKGATFGVEAQTTTYVYGTTANQGSPAIYRNDVLAAVIYPDSDDVPSPLGNGADTVYDRLEHTYDYAGRKSTLKDQRGVIHTMVYDAFGRLQSDQATTIPSGVDAAIQRIDYAFDDLSRVQKVSSYSATSGGTLVNEVKHTYDGWGNQTVCEQSHVGAVGGGTPSVQVTFADGAVSGEAKYVRPSSFTYPNARVVNVDYSGTIDDKLSRVGRLAHSTGSPIYAEYTYLGAGSIVKITHPQVTGGLTFNYGDATGSPAGWDRFGRPVDHKWGSTADANKLERFQHTYDNMSRRLTSDRTYTGAPTNRDEQYTYDNLHRLKNMKRGTLSGGTISDASSTLQIDWNALDILGNWRSWRWDLNGGVPAYITQGRSHNKANEIDVNNNDADAAGASITQTGGSGSTMNWQDPTYDKNGNMKTGPRPGAETTASSNLVYTYDAWNRLVIVKSGSGGTTTLAEYQFDGMHRRIVKLKPNGANWDRVDYYYNSSAQVLEERSATALANKTTVATVPKYQWVWDLRYQDAVILRDENKDGDGDCIDGTDVRLYYVQDANFNTTALITTAGAVTERVAYNPYGRATTHTSSWGSQAATVHNNDILFGGYRLDTETQLYHVRARTYHSTLGRFLERDPMGYHDGMNLYQYVGSVPTMMTDPSGMVMLKMPRPETAQPWWVQYWLDRGVTKIRLDVLQSWLAGLGATGFVLPCPEQTRGGKPIASSTVIPVAMWIHDDSDDLIVGFVRGMMVPRGRAQGGHFMVGIHNMNSSVDLDLKLQEKVSEAATFMLTTPDNVCVSEYNVVTHRGGDPGTITFRNTQLWSMPNFRYLPSDDSRIANSPSGADTSTLDYAGMNVLGKTLRDYACKNSCSVGVYACTFGSSLSSMKDLAKSSTCNVLGTTSTNSVGNLGWFMDYDGNVVRVTPDGNVTTRPGPVGRSRASLAPIQRFGH